MFLRAPALTRPSAGAAVRPSTGRPIAAPRVAVRSVARPTRSSAPVRAAPADASAAEEETGGFGGYGEG
jgi:hypothetical protein